MIIVFFMYLLLSSQIPYISRIEFPNLCNNLLLESTRIEIDGNNHCWNPIYINFAQISKRSPHSSQMSLETTNLQHFVAVVWHGYCELFNIFGKMCNTWIAISMKSMDFATWLAMADAVHLIVFTKFYPFCNCESILCAPLSLSHFHISPH